MQDLSFLQEPPELDRMAGRLAVRALCPVSMCDSPTASFLPTEMVPTERHLIGMIENAMGLHFGSSKTVELRREIEKHHSESLSFSKRGRASRRYQPLIATHYSFELVSEEGGDRYTDTQWHHKWRSDPTSHPGSLDHRATSNSEKSQARYRGMNRTLVEREYVSGGNWQWRVYSSQEAANALEAALDDPAAPLYIGTSESWAHAHFSQGPIQR